MSQQSKRVGREYILDQAEALFTQHGYQGVSMRMLAEASGVTNAALYYHFENKEALFSEVMRFHTDKLNRLIQRAAEKEDSYQAKIAAMARIYFQQVSNRRSFVFLLRQKVKGIDLPEDKTHFMKMLKTVFGPFDRVMEEAAAAGEVVELPQDYSAASLLVGMLHGLGGYRLICHEQTLTEEDVNFLVDLLWNGISLPRPGSR